ncbi:hypothetical protein B0H13DRAFT_1896988 [Mycena leptocephala]|nr:hypothetical protein B0H13DRAFT_1896988 [Mycena leptocephala]
MISGGDRINYKAHSDLAKCRGRAVKVGMGNGGGDAAVNQWVSARKPMGPKWLGRRRKETRTGGVDAKKKWVWNINGRCTNHIRWRAIARAELRKSSEDRRMEGIRASGRRRIWEDEATLDIDDREGGRKEVLVERKGMEDDEEGMSVVNTARTDGEMRRNEEGGDDAKEKEGKESDRYGREGRKGGCGLGSVFRLATLVDRKDRVRTYGSRKRRMRVWCIGHEDDDGQASERSGGGTGDDGMGVIEGGAVVEKTPGMEGKQDAERMEGEADAGPWRADGEGRATEFGAGSQLKQAGTFESG